MARFFFISVDDGRLANSNWNNLLKIYRFCLCRTRIKGLIMSVDVSEQCANGGLRVA